MEYGYYENQATFVQQFKITDKAAFVLEGDLRGQVCSEVDGQCIPVKIDFSYNTKDLPSTFVVAAEKKADIAEAEPVRNNTLKEPYSVTDSLAQVPPAPVDNNTNADLWQPVIEEVRAYGAAGDTSDMSILWIFLGGFGGGLIALLTPCVWPMIPMTVSFFLKRNKKSRKMAIRDAVTYGLGIIIIYVTLGLLITGIFGASALNDLSTSALFNLIFFALLVIFAISFFGAFEMVLPSSWTNKMDQKADSTTGIISIFFMAFTLALVSFSCTGPIIGTLLVQAAGSGVYYSTGCRNVWLCHSTGYPVFIICYISFLARSMPKSGGWLNSVKVVLGFLELALALKFLSVADLAYGWGILDREVFLVLWIVIFVLLGVYLLGKLKLPHDSELPHVSVPRLFMLLYLSLSPFI